MASMLFLLGDVLALWAWTRAASLGFALLSGDTVILNSQAQVNKLIDVSSINIGPELMHGKWVVLFFRHDCELCSQAIPRYDDWATARQQSGLRLAAIEIPPFGNAPPTIQTGVTGKLTEKHIWIATTPFVVLVKDGIVKATTEGEQAEDPPVDW